MCVCCFRVVQSEAVTKAASLIREIITSQLAGPTLIRLAWHDAGTYDKNAGKWGPRASMRFSPESDAGANAGLDEARALLAPVKQAVPELSIADIWQLAGVISVEMMGGPKVPFRVGRVDATSAAECAPAGTLLPGGHDTADQLRATFGRMGFNDREIVALSGAHSVGRCHADRSGFNGAWDATPLTFDNLYFKDILEKSFTPPATQMLTGNGQHNTVDGTMMLDPDLQLKFDARMLPITQEYAAQRSAFFRDFSAAFQKLGELGWRSLADVKLAASAPPSMSASVEKATAMIYKIVEQQLAGPVFIRLAWHDAGTYDASNGKWGPRGSMRFSPEKDNGSNAGLAQAQALLCLLYTSPSPRDS